LYGFTDTSNGFVIPLWISNFIVIRGRLTFLKDKVILLQVILSRSAIMKVTSKGQVTIPRHIRQKLGITPASDVEFVIEGNVVLLRAGDGTQSRGKRIVNSLKGRATVRMTTDEIMALTRGEN
jgi:antitoxin PrlF